MVRGLAILLMILLVMVLLVGGATLWMGPGLANLAFLDPNRGSPYTLLDLRAWNLHRRYVPAISARW